jgi:hypothetical protein
MLKKYKKIADVFLLPSPSSKAPLIETQSLRRSQFTSCFSSHRCQKLSWLATCHSIHLGLTQEWRKQPEEWWLAQVALLHSFSHRLLLLLHRLKRQLMLL